MLINASTLLTDIVRFGIANWLLKSGELGSDTTVPSWDIACGVVCKPLVFVSLADYADQDQVLTSLMSTDLCLCHVVWLEAGELMTTCTISLSLSCFLNSW